jgi:hypothetical protein
MSSLPFDPYRAERRWRWHNQWAHWRADASQTLFHAGALLLLLALLSLPARDALVAAAPSLRGLVQRWPLACALLAGLLLTLQQVRALQALQRRQARHWLMAQPVAAAVRARRRRETLALHLLLQLLLGTAVLLLAAVGLRALLGYALCAAAASAIAAPLARHLGARTARTPLDPRLQDAGVGRLWRWQRIEAGVGLRGRRLALGLWFWLLVPLGSGLGVVLALATAGMLLTLLLTAWQRSLQVLPRAQQWLGAQPLSGAELLRATVVFPSLVLTTAAASSVALLLVLGTPALAWLLGAAVLTLGALQYACTAAERRRPRRIALQLCLQLVLLVALAQALPPLLLVGIPLQLAWLLRRAVRA